VYPINAGSSYRAKLKWKTNLDTTGRIHAGAGMPPTFSPTTLSAKMLPSGIQSASSQAQYLLAASDGTTWQDIDAATLALNIPSGPAAATVVLSGNADLWTERPGVNQDIGIFLSTAGGGDQLVGWKESGGNAGTFSPNPAFVQAVVPLAAGTSQHDNLKEKSNATTPAKT